MTRLGGLSRIAGFAVVLGVAAAPGSATPIIASPTGLASPDQTITFSEFVFPSGTPIDDEYASLGVTFSPRLYYDSQPGFFPTASINNFSVCCGPRVDPVSLVFSSVQSAVAFNFITNEGASRFTALLHGVLVESFLTPTTLNTTLFYGFEGISFDEIMIDAGGSNHSFGLAICRRPFPSPRPSSCSAPASPVLCFALALGSPDRGTTVEPVDPAFVAQGGEEAR